MTSSINIPAVRVRDFSADTTVTGDHLELRLAGSADVPAIGPLSELLPKLHEEVVRTKIKLVVVDILELDFMNSSCFKAFVSWIAAVQDADEQYRVKFLSNPNMFWQSRSLHALTCFADDLITVETP